MAEVMQSPEIQEMLNDPTAMLKQMKGSGLVDDAQIDEYLANPQKYEKEVRSRYLCGTFYCCMGMDSSRFFLDEYLTARDLGVGATLDAPLGVRRRCPNPTIRVALENR